MSTTLHPSLITADARTVSPRQFLDALGLTSADERETYRRNLRASCIRAIARGDTYGFPPALVDECRAELAEDDLALVPVDRISPTRVAA